MARKTRPLDIAQHPQSQDSSANHAQKPADDLITKGKVVAAKVQPGAQEEQHRAAERGYWRRELRLMWWLNWITGVAVVGGILSLIYIKRTLDATWAAADAARIQAQTAMKQLELSERPWVTADVRLTCPFQMGRSVCIEVSVENIGHSVAMYVSVEAVVVLSETFTAFLNRVSSEGKPRPSDLEAMSETSCGKMARVGSVSGRGRLVLFPNRKETIQHRGIPIYEGKMEEKIMESSPELGTLVQPVLVGCVIYRSTLSRWNYRTGFVYQISSVHHPEGYVAINEVHPVEDLRLKPLTYSEVYGRVD